LIEKASLKVITYNLKSDVSLGVSVRRRTHPAGSVKSDVWALGCVLYELATLRHAFDGSSLPNVVMRIVQGTYAPLPAGYSASLKELVAALLQRHPKVLSLSLSLSLSVPRLILEWWPSFHTAPASTLPPDLPAASF
jgi:serine/threonine protein kinase